MFVRYLEAYTKLPEKKEGKEAEPAEVKSRRSKVAKSNERILTAMPLITQSDEKEKKEKGTIGEIGRLWNEYPLVFDGLYAIDPAFFAIMSDKVLKLITKGKYGFEKITDEAPKPASKITSDDIGINYRHALTEHVKLELTNILRQIILKSCNEILNENGEIIPDVFRLYPKLNELFASYAEQPKILFALKAQLIYSHMSQIVFANITEQIANMYINKIPDKKERTFKNDILQLILRSYEPIIFDIRVLSLTNFIPDIVQEYINKKFFQKTRVQHCTEELEKLDPEFIVHIIQADIKQTQAISSQIPKIKDNGILINKIKFWFKVLELVIDKFKNEGKLKDFHIMAAIYNTLTEKLTSLPTEVLKIQKNISEKYATTLISKLGFMINAYKDGKKADDLQQVLMLYDVILKTFSQDLLSKNKKILVDCADAITLAPISSANEKKSEKKDEKDKGSELDTLKKLLYSVDNEYILEHMRPYLTKKASTQDERKFVDHLTKLQQDRDVLQTPTESLLKDMIFTVAEDGKAGFQSKFISSLDKYNLGMFSSAPKAKGTPAPAATSSRAPGLSPVQDEKKS